MKGALVLVAAMAPGAASARAGVEVLPKPAEKRVDVLVDGRPFTAYVWPERLRKPVQHIQTMQETWLFFSLLLPMEKQRISR